MTKATPRNLHALEDRFRAALALSRTLEPYHLLILSRDMLPYLAADYAKRRAGMSEQPAGVAFERRPSPVAGSMGQRVRYEL